MFSSKRLLPFTLLLFSSPCWASWTCQQGATGCTVTTTRSCTVTGTTCNITVTSTHAHAVEVLCAAVGSTTTTLSASASDGGFTVAAASHGSDASPASGEECSYNLNATGGATTIACTVSSSTTTVCIFFEFTGTGSSFIFDSGAAVDDTTACTSCNGAALTLGTSNNYILIQASSCGGTCSAINQSYTAVFVTGDGAAFKINVSSAGTTPAWTMTSARMAGGAIAIYEVTGGTKTCTLSAMGAGPC